MAAHEDKKEVTNVQQQSISAKKSPGRLGSTLKRVTQYLRDQAHDQNSSTLYLDPVTRDQRTQYILRTSDGRELLPNDLDQRLIGKTSRLDGSRHPPQYSTSTVPPYLPCHPPRSSTTMTTSSASGPGIFRDMIRHQYASDNILQSYDVLRPNRTVNKQLDTVWVVYIHGGYFRDFTIDSTSFKPTISLIEEDSSQSSLRNHISGYASLNYRLAPHEDHPQDPMTTPTYTLNNAHWPNQPDDIISALRHLQTTYPASKCYILAGHSVGATLTFLTTLKCLDAGLAPPKAIIGTCGIYDYPTIHKTCPGYDRLTNKAMDESQYQEASPALYSAEQYTAGWNAEEEADRVVVLAHSKDDELVPGTQTEAMSAVLQGKHGFRTEVMEIDGLHDDLWKKGGNLVKTIDRAIAMI